nr:MAG TPA: hypothetical protein [Caudoviricetes sp.]
MINKLMPVDRPIAKIHKQQLPSSNNSFLFIDISFYKLFIYILYIR